jgi:hypothetical protein
LWYHWAKEVPGAMITRLRRDRITGTDTVVRFGMDLLPFSVNPVMHAMLEGMAY